MREHAGQRHLLHQCCMGQRSQKTSKPTLAHRAFGTPGLSGHSNLPVQFGRNPIEQFEIFRDIPDSSCSQNERLLLRTRWNVSASEIVDDPDLIWADSVLAF